MGMLDDLRKVLFSERETGRLTQIPPDLFDRTCAAVSSLVTKVYAIEDPFSDEARTLIEETISIQETAKEVFVIRAKKIVALSENQAQGNYIDRDEVKKMVAPEREMFDRISTAIGTCQGTLFSKTQQSLSVHDESLYATVPDQNLQQAATVTPQPAEAPAPAYVVVRILADMDNFMGIDGRIYRLARGDIVTLPERNAEVLVERNIALNMNLGK